MKATTTADNPPIHQSSLLFLPLLALLAAIIAGCREEAVGPQTRVVEAMNRGVSLMGQYQYEPAVQAFEEALKSAPDLEEARLNLAMALFNRNRKEDLERSQKLLEEVLQKQPENLRALYFKAIVLQHIGKAQEAVPCVEKVTQKRPEDGAAWYLLGLCRMRTGQPAEADFLKAIEHRPYLYSAYYQLYQSRIRAGEQQEAMKYLEKFQALRQSPLGESVEFPQYNQMGELALAKPLPSTAAPPVSKSRFSLGTPQTIFAWPDLRSPSSDLRLGGITAADFNRDGLPDLIVPAGPGGRVLLLPQTARLKFTDASAGSGLEAVTNALSCAAGDYDNDDVADVAFASANGCRLFHGKGDGTFTEVTGSTGLNQVGGSVSQSTETPIHRSTETPATTSTLFLDADHDGDLDLFVCAVTSNQLWNNNGNGSFTNVAAGRPLATQGSRTALVLPGDVDQDRDMDLVLLQEGQPAKVFLNQLLGSYAETNLAGLNIRGELGGVLQDFTGDTRLDLLVLGGDPRQFALFTGNHEGSFKRSDAFAHVAEAMASWGPISGFRTADIDLDGDLDVISFGAQMHLLLNDGQGRFVIQSVAGSPMGVALQAGECMDLTGDLIPDFLVIQSGATNRLLVLTGQLDPPSTAVAVQPTGIRSRDDRTRSPASGYGVNIVARAGLREQRRFYSGQTGGASQSPLPLVLGLGGAGKADYVSFTWPDGVAQMEIGLAAGQIHKVAELQRKVSSCPVLFAWNGSRFEFITDFAGVGGLGYFSAPGIYAPPQVLEHVKIEPAQLRPRNGCYELRVTEPMEESAYVDRLELLVIDHPSGSQVFPDERLSVTGTAPTHELLVVSQPVFPLRATGPSGAECGEKIKAVDRTYAYEPPVDRRYVGFCKPHSLELDFGPHLGSLAPTKRVFLFINGFIEYPYSQTVYAAGQSRLGWEAIRVEREEPDGQWKAIVPDGGAPGGIARTMTIDLSGKLTSATRKIRLTTNLEVFYDQVFLAGDDGTSNVNVQPAPLAEATLRRVGFPREYSPDGRLPLIYDYDLPDATAPFKVLKGAYTRYGDVRELLTRFDDRYVIMGPGDEIALKFSSSALAAPPAGYTRSFVLVSHAYCKDMDLYTGTPKTVEPLPFRTMSRYPYPGTETYPAGDKEQAFLKTYNTRIVQ